MLVGAPSGHVSHAYLLSLYLWGPTLAQSHASWPPFDPPHHPPPHDVLCAC